MELEPADIARACCIAMSDSAFYTPTICGEDSDLRLDIEIISWPKAKMAEWIARPQTARDYS